MGLTFSSTSERRQGYRNGTTVSGSQVSAPTAPAVSLGTATNATQPLTFSGGSGATTWNLLYKAASDSGWTTFSSLTVGVGSATVTGLSADTSYSYKVVASNVVGTAESTPASGYTLPTATTVSNTSQSTTVVRFTFTGGSYGTSWTGYYRTPAGSGSYTQVSLTAHQAYYDLTVASEATADFYVVTANAAGSATSNTSTGAGASLPVAPSVSLGTPTATTQPLTFSGGSNATSWTLKYKTHASGTWLTFSTPTVGASSATVTGLSADINYDFKIVATNTAGSTDSTTATGYTLPSATAVTASRQSDTVIRFTFTGGSAGTGWTGYYRTPSGSGSYTSVSLTQNQAYYDLTVSSQSTADFYVVIANSAGNATSNTATGSAAASLFTDTFSTGDFTHAENGISWAGGANASVVSKSGTISGKVLRFTYAAGAYQAEKRFNLGTIYDELWFEVVVDVPANYYHPTTGQTTYNNKFFYLWNGDKTDGSNGYSSYNYKQALELNPISANNGSQTRPMYGTNAGYGGFASSNWNNIGNQTFLTPSADAGQTRTFVFHLKIDTTAGIGGPAQTGGNAALGCWKDGVKIYHYTTLRQGAPDGKARGFDFGYLMGWADATWGDGSASVLWDFQSVRIATTNIFGVTP